MKKNFTLPRPQLSRVLVFFFRSILDGLKEKYGLLVVYLKLNFSNNKLATDCTSSSMSVSVNNIISLYFRANWFLVYIKLKLETHATGKKLVTC